MCCINKTFIKVYPLYSFWSNSAHEIFLLVEFFPLPLSVIKTLVPLPGCLIRRTYALVKQLLWWGRETLPYWENQCDIWIKIKSHLQLERTGRHLIQIWSQNRNLQISKPYPQLVSDEAGAKAVKLIWHWLNEPTVLSWTRDWQQRVVEDAVSTPVAHRHFLDSSPAPSNNSIPVLSKYSLFNPPLHFASCLYSIWKALGLSFSKVSSKASWNKPRIRQQSPSKQRIQTTFLPQLATLTLCSCHKTHMHQNQKQLLSTRSLPPDEPGAKKPTPAAIHQLWKGNRCPDCRGWVTHWTTLGFTLRQQAMGWGGGGGSGSQGGMAGLAGRAQTFHPPALSSCKVTFRTPEKSKRRQLC